jgi:halocyanin-like protein
VSNYEGTVDYTGREEATVSVGAGENGLLFDPPAVLVDPGTTVVWEWTGAGGAHGVAHEPDGGGEPAFESEVVEDAGHTFGREFQESVTFRYYCPSHRGADMKGVVAVGSTEDVLVQPESGDGDGGGGSLTTVDLVVAGTAVALGVVLVLMAASAASSPGPDRDRPG